MNEKQKARKKAKLEEELLKLYEKLETLSARLSDPKLYEDFEKAQQVGEEVEGVQAQIQAKEAELEALAKS